MATEGPPTIVRWSAVGLVALLGAGSVGCGAGRLVLDPPPRGAQARSLVGDTLWSVSLPPELARDRVGRLIEAQRRSHANPDDEATLVLHGRRLAELGRLREAVAVYTAGLDRNPLDPRLRRRRAELLLTLREPDAALADLDRAVARARVSPDRREYLEDDEGQLVAGSTLHASHWLRGVVHYVRGDFGRALIDLTEAATTATHADELVATEYWIYLSLLRVGRLAEARSVLATLPGETLVGSRKAEWRILRTLGGGRSLDSLRRDLVGASDRAAETVYLYALAVTMLTGNRTQEGADLLGLVTSLGQWHHLAAVAADADLARRAAPCPGPLPALPAERRWTRCRGVPRR